MRRCIAHGNNHSVFKPIVSYEGRSIITVSSTIPSSARRRFAAAHELGHYEMHRTVAPVFSDTAVDLVDWYQQIEQEKQTNQVVLLEPELIPRGT